MGWIAQCGDGLDIRVRLTPKASSDRIGGPAQTADGKSHLRVHVRAVPEKGAANAALEKLIARALSIAGSRVSVASGAASRIKTVHIRADLTPDLVRARLEGEGHER